MKKLKITRKRKFTRKIKVTRRIKEVRILHRKGPEIYVVRPYGSCRYFATVNKWSKTPILMTKYKAQKLKAEIDKVYYGDIRIEILTK